MHQPPLRNRGCATDVYKSLKPGHSWVETVVVTPSSGGRTAPIRGLIHALMLTGAALSLIGCAALSSAVVLLHLGVRPVLSGSMSPTYGPGAIVVTKPVSVEGLHVGMIPLFVPPGEHGEFAHRITSISGARENPIITTKGDANKAPDPWHARFTTATVPVVVGTQPWVGRLLVGIRGPIQLMLIILGGLLIAVSGARWILRPQRSEPTFA
jgi:signal peptidase I